jgi:hypothetical protein
MKRKRSSGKVSRKRAAAVADAPAPEPDPSGVETANLSLHDLFAQQMRTMLDRTDLDEEAKQSLLIAASCPCCGAGGFSFTAKIKRRS